DLPPPRPGDAPDVRVVLLDRVVVALALDRQAVLGARQLVHQALVGRVGLQLRVRLADRDQLADRALELVRGLDFFRPGRSAHHRRARIGDVVEDAFLVPRVSLHRLDQVRDQIRASLELVLDLAPGGLHRLLFGDDAVVSARPAAGERQDEDRGVPAHAHWASSHGGQCNTQPPLRPQTGTRFRRYSRTYVRAAITASRSGTPRASP